MQANVGLSGRVGIKRITPPGPGIMWKVKNFPNVWGGLWRSAVAQAFGMSHLEGRLYARLFRDDGSIVDYGLLSRHLVTTAFVNHLVDELKAYTEFNDYKYHDSGVGVTAANITDTDIETTDGESRATGSQIEGASANIYKSVGTISYTTTKAITEHGLFCNLTGATLMDRHVFSAINVNNGDSIQFTYELTASAGG